MESISRFHLGQHQNGTWHVIDVKTEGPAEIQVGEKLYLLWGMPKSEAENWSLLLNQLARRCG
jgi:hypothetical protein